MLKYAVLGVGARRDRRTGSPILAFFIGPASDHLPESSNRLTAIEIEFRAALWKDTGKPEGCAATSPRVTAIRPLITNVRRSSRSDVRAGIKPGQHD